MRLFIVDISSEQRQSENVASYVFNGAEGKVRWPMLNGMYLGMAGAFNTFLRLGLSPELVKLENIPRAASGDILVICVEGENSPRVRDSLQCWLKQGGKVLASGHLASFLTFLPASCSTERSCDERPYSALAFLLEEGVAELVSPPAWHFWRIRLDQCSGVTAFGSVAVIHGERQTPARALVTPIPDAPAGLRHGNFYFLNAYLFSAFQSWLQGQEDLQPWLSWRHRLFWLDEQVGFFSRLFQEVGLLPFRYQTPGIAGLRETTIVLRHDLDYSRDISYLKLEETAGIVGVHAILRDRNTVFWRDLLRDCPRQEMAFHYNTARYSRVWNAVRTRILGLPTRSYLPAKGSIAGTGLLRQVRWAKRNGIDVATLHRHLSFIYYPEYVDALDAVLEAEKTVLGGSSYFRSQLLRWGGDRADGARGTYADFPDPQFPYWFPFRLAHSGQGGRLLRGWESTSMMELEPQLLEQMLDHSVPGVPQRVITLNFHPAHANDRAYSKNGCIGWFNDIIELCKRRGVGIRTLADVYRMVETKK